MAEAVFLESVSEENASVSEENASASMDYDSDSENNNKEAPEKYDENFFTKIVTIEHDLLVNIVRHLDSLSLFRLEQTCKSLKSMIEQSNIWRRMYDRLLPEFYPVEQSQNISLRVSDQSQVTSYRKSVLKFDNLVTNLRTGRCETAKVGPELGFPGDVSGMKMTMDPNSLFMVDRAEVIVLPFGKTGRAFDFSNISFQVEDICSQGSSMVVQMVPRIPIGDLIGIGLHASSILGYFKYDELSSNYDIKANSELIVGDIYDCIKISLFKQTILLPVYSEDDTKILIYKYSINGELIEQAGVITLVLPQIRNPDVGFEIWMQPSHFVWYSFSSKMMCVWDIDQPSFSNRELIPVWSKDKFFLPKDVTCFDLCYPYLLVAGAGTDRRCQVWDCESDTLVRMLEHDMPHANASCHEPCYYHGVWRQVSVSDSAHIIVSLSECGLLIGWDKPKCLRSDKSVSSKSLILWTINTNHCHVTPVVSFVMNSSRLITLEQQKTCDDENDDGVRSYIVVRDFWKK